ncbi:MAG: (2Fe-2S)-binding protein, partial [Achromobacter sp.]|uniref:(2Fe-2S)-binding protein n=1 Tax=Achromobacter sp. TaxID=134375 RepID=UPI003D03BA62
DRAAALPGMLRVPALLAKGLYCMAWLRAHGVPLCSGVRPVAVAGTDRVTGLSYRQGERTHMLDCDAVGFGLSLRPETQLASLIGCDFEFNERDRNWIPRRDAAGRSSVAGVYVAGDGAGIGGADAAELAGERAALALLEDTGHPHDTRRARVLESQLAANGRVRDALERAFPFPEDWAAGIADDTVVCRCEEVTAGAIRQAVHQNGVREMNRLKALTRVGMGRCQGRMCGVAGAEVLAHAVGCAPRAVGRLRNQPPVKPIPVNVVCLERPAKRAA